MFGFEESYGYLSGPYVRDKDGVGAACLICEMFSYYAARGVSLPDRLRQLYRDHGYCLNTLHSYAFDGSAGFAFYCAHEVGRKNRSGQAAGEKYKKPKAGFIVRQALCAQIRRQPSAYGIDQKRLQSHDEHERPGRWVFEQSQHAFSRVLLRG